MQTDTEAEPKRRSILARVGVCLLNLLQPGLGLIRLGRYRSGLILLASMQAGLVAILAWYPLGPELSFERYMALVALALVAFVAVFVVAIVLTWRGSAWFAPRVGRLWRWYGIVGVFAACVAVSFLIPSPRDYYRPFYAASSSMAPTLHPNDRMIAQMWNLAPPKRGDVVIVAAHGEEWVTRVVGIPGDTIAMTNGTIVLNGKPIAQRVQAGAPSTLLERLPGEARSHAIRDSGRTFIDDYAPVRLGSDAYFMLGDNRDHSSDSRTSRDSYGLGLVSREQIVGRVLFSWWRNGVGLRKASL